MSILIRKGNADDIPSVLDLINELAVYEKAPEAVIVNVQSMLQDFHDKAYDFFVAEDNGDVVGIALFYFAYSTWKGKIMYLDDLVITESRRRDGLGKMLFDALVKEADEKNAHQMRWHVLDWNQPAIKFYEKINADLDSEWIQCKLEIDDIPKYLEKLA